MKIRQATKKGYVEIPEWEVFDAAYPKSKTRRGRYSKGLCPTIISTNMEIYVYEGENSADRQPASTEERVCEPAGRESVSSEWTGDDPKGRQQVLGYNSIGGVSRTLLATYHKIGMYNVLEHNFPAVIEIYEDSFV